MLGFVRAVNSTAIIFLHCWTPFRRRYRTSIRRTALVTGCVVVFNAAVTVVFLILLPGASNGGVITFIYVAEYICGHGAALRLNGAPWRAVGLMILLTTSLTVATAVSTIGVLTMGAGAASVEEELSVRCFLCAVCAASITAAKQVYRRLPNVAPHDAMLLPVFYASA
eukprot:gene35554-29756_t